VRPNKKPLAAVQGSGIGTTRTFRNVRYPVAIGGKADLELGAFNMSTQPNPLGLVCGCAG